VVVVTCGEEGCWYTSDGIAVRHLPAFAVETVDPTGCGDVFHGAYAALLARGIPLEERLRAASAAAALKAGQPGAQAGAPTWPEVTAFLAARNETGPGL
jgi:sulfofructose kinase